MSFFYDDLSKFQTPLLAEEVRTKKKLDREENRNDTWMYSSTASTQQKQVRAKRLWKFYAVTLSSCFYSLAVLVPSWSPPNFCLMRIRNNSKIQRRLFYSCRLWLYLWKWEPSFWMTRSALKWTVTITPYSRVHTYVDADCFGSNHNFIIPSPERRKICVAARKISFKQTIGRNEVTADDTRQHSA